MYDCDQARLSWKKEMKVMGDKGMLSSWKSQDYMKMMNAKKH